MSQQETPTRNDQLTLYPMQNKLDTAEELKLKSGIVLWLMAMSVPILLLFELRYVMVGGYVDPNANAVLGGIGLVLLIVSAILTSVAKRAGGPDRRRTALASYTWSAWCTFAAFILIGWHVVDGSMSTVTHYGMTFMTAVGSVDFYVLCMLLAVWATRGRVKRLSMENTWGLSATSYFAWFIVAAWLIIYVLMYFL